MQTKQKFSLLLVVVILNLFSFNSALADTPPANSASSTISDQPVSSTQGSVLGLQAPPVPQTIADVKSAKQQLAGIKLNYEITPVYKNVKSKKTGKTSKIISSYNLANKDIALAVLNPATNSIIVTVGRQTDKTMVFPDPAVDIKLVKFNGVNSKFSVNLPANGQVLALKYLISKDSGSKAAIENSLAEAIYVPYSANFAQPDVLAYGANYLNGIIKNVAADLANLPSSAVPGKTITQAIRPSLIKSLVYAEHTDTAQVLYGGDTQGTINQLNIIFALNEGDAYKYSVSTAGARGITQFIPSTYLGLVKRHAEANLNPDFVAGMSDHENAIKATYLLLDDYAGAVRVKTGGDFMGSRVFDYGAASYNAGVTRVAKAVLAFGDNWSLDQSSQAGSLQAQVAGLTSQAKLLKVQIKKAAKQAKADLQDQLASASQQLAETKKQLDNVKSASLKNETVNYLQKIYKVIPLFNEEQLAVGN